MPSCRIKILILAYHFPPMGGAGSQRSLKFAKYLPEFDVQPTVIAGVEDGDSRWSPKDQQLCEELDSDLLVYRIPIPNLPATRRTLRHRIAKILGRTNPSESVWVQEAIEVGSQVCERKRPDIIFATMSPFESATIARILSKKYAIPWVADLRDPWALDEWRVFPSRWHRRLRLNEMGGNLETASLVIMNTPEAAASCQAAYSKRSSIPIDCITNGYDAADFELSVDLEKQDKFKIVHAGALHSEIGLEQKRRALYYRFWGKLPVGVELLPRSHYYLIRALEGLLERHPEIFDDIRLELLGVSTDTDRELVAQSKIQSITRFTGYLPHLESVEKIQQSDLLFLPMHKIGKGKRATIVPGKTYEYMATGKTILAAVPAGDARDFLQKRKNTLICEPDDIESLSNNIFRAYRSWKTDSAHEEVDFSFVEKFERKALTKKLSEFLRNIYDKHSTHNG